MGLMLDELLNGSPFYNGSSEEEVFKRLHRLYAEGTRKLKNYQIPESLELFKNCIYKLYFYFSLYLFLDI